MKGRNRFRDRNHTKAGDTGNEPQSRLGGPKKSGPNFALYAILAVGLIYLIVRLVIYWKNA